MIEVENKVVTDTKDIEIVRIRQEMDQMRLMISSLKKKQEQFEIDFKTNAGLYSMQKTEIENLRNEALINIQQLLFKSNFKIMPNDLNDLFKSIGQRIKDPHKGVQKG